MIKLYNMFPIVYHTEKRSGMKNIIIMTLSFQTMITYAAGFGGNTTIKIIPKYLPKFNMYDNELRKSSSFFDLYIRQSRLKNNKNFSMQTWAPPFHDLGGMQEYTQCSSKKIKIIKENVKRAIGINLSKKKKQKHALDFDIICGKDQMFPVPIEVDFGYVKAQNLSQGDSIMCVQQSHMSLKKIHEIIDIYNNENELFRLISPEKCAVLISRHGAMALVEPEIEQEK
jgi:hypothetical protein